MIKKKITCRNQHVAGGYSIAREDILTSRKVPKKCYIIFYFNYYIQERRIFAICGKFTLTYFIVF